MERQVNKLCQVCYFHLRCLRMVRQSLTKESLLTFVHTFITSRVDHCNGVLYGQMNIFSIDFNPSWTRLQGWSWVFLSSTTFLPPSAMNFTGCRSGNSIRFKIALLVRHCIVGAAPEYLTELCRLVSSFILWSAESTLCLTWWFHCSEIQTSKIWLLGFCCLWAPCVELSSDLKLDNRVTIYYSSRVNWKHFCSSSPQPFWGSISNEGAYKYSILPLLLLLLLLLSGKT